MKATQFLKRIFGNQQAVCDRSEALLSIEMIEKQGADYVAEGELDKAEKYYLEVLCGLPDCAEIYMWLGQVYQRQQRYVLAESLLNKAINLKPSLYEGYASLGKVSEGLNKTNQAITYYECALDLYRTRERASLVATPEVYWWLAELYRTQQLFQKLFSLMEEVIVANPEQIEAYCNLGLAFDGMGQSEEAVALLEHLMMVYPKSALGPRYLGNMCFLKLNQFERARQLSERAFLLDSEDFGAALTQAEASLVLGDYENGWRQFSIAIRGYQIRDAVNPQSCNKFFKYLWEKFTKEKEWKGEYIPGKTLLCWTEQGAGDNLMMLRFLPVLKQHSQAQKIIVLCEQALFRTISGLPDIDEVIVKTEDVDHLEFDYHCTTMSLPHFMQINIHTVPAKTPYIFTSELSKVSWSERIASLPGLKVGLVWSGGKFYFQDQQRSIPLKKFESLLNVQGITWISLQKGEPAEQLKELKWPIIDWTEELEDFQDTAALIECLDLTISVDTSVIHLAGALGCPAWLIHRAGVEWRWLLEREDSPWYPSIRIFRELSQRDWNSIHEDLIRKIKTELECWVKFQIRHEQPAPFDSVDHQYWHWIKCLESREDYEAVMSMLREVVLVCPSCSEAYYKMGMTLKRMGRGAEAIAHFKQALALQPDDARVSKALADNYLDVQEFSLARESYAMASRLDVNDAFSPMAYAQLSLLLGDYGVGWRGYYKAMPAFQHAFFTSTDAQVVTDWAYFNSKLKQERGWQGDSLQGKVILVWTEQGLGDSLMMFRYIPMLKTHYQARKVMVVCERTLMSLVEQLEGVDEVIPKYLKSEDIPYQYSGTCVPDEGETFLAFTPVHKRYFNVHCSTMNFPYLMKTQLDTIPGNVPYLFVNTQSSKKWKERCASLAGLKVGLAWSGGKLFKKDAIRSIPLKMFEPLMHIDGIQWVSLQKGEAAGQLNELGWSMIDWTDDFGDMQDTAALIENLDLVISVDTSVIHLAGALGCSAWLLHRYGSEWRWLLDREESPWYPSVRIFRELSLRDWGSISADLIKKIEVELRTLQDCYN